MHLYNEIISHLFSLSDLPGYFNPLPHSLSKYSCTLGHNVLLVHVTMVYRVDFPPVTKVELAFYAVQKCLGCHFILFSLKNLYGSDPLL